MADVLSTKGKVKKKLLHISVELVFEKREFGPFFFLSLSFPTLFLS